MDGWHSFVELQKSAHAPSAPLQVLSFYSLISTKSAPSRPVQWFFVLGRTIGWKGTLLEVVFRRIDGQMEAPAAACTGQAGLLGRGRGCGAGLLHHSRPHGRHPGPLCLERQEPLLA